MAWPLMAAGGSSEGVWHIWIGFDHILFLLALLLPAVLWREAGRWWRTDSFRATMLNVTGIVTAFTVAHSLTLSLAVLGWVNLPARWVESAITATVILAALNNLYPLVQGRRWLLAFGLALALTGNPADAEEVVGDVYLQIWQRAAQYDALRGSGPTWLLIHCRSLALNRLRRRPRHETSQVELGGEVVQEQPDPAAGVDELLTLIQEGTRVHHAMQDLSEEQRQLIVLAYFRDLSHQQIAAATGVPLGTVKSHIRRGLQVLRTALQA